MRLIQVALHVDDPDRAEAFYGRLFAMPPAGRFDPPGLVFFRVGDVRVLLERNAPPALLYYAVDDVHARVERLRADGVEVESEPHVIFTHLDDSLGTAGVAEWQAFIRDSEGNLVGLVELRPPE